MASPTKAAGAKSPGRTPNKFPPITVGRVEETGRLLERVARTNQQLFIDAGQEYKDKHRQASSRPLTPVEAVQIAAALDTPDKIKAAEKLQKSALRAYDEPDAREVIFAAGLAIAPAFMEAVTDVVALVEMPADEFEAACENDTLGEAIEERASILKKLEIGDARELAADAMAHYAKSAGFEPGEGWSLPVQAVWQALKTAVNSLVAGSQSSQLIGSAESTEDSRDERSSTGSRGQKP